MAARLVIFCSGLAITVSAAGGNRLATALSRSRRPPPLPVHAQRVTGVQKELLLAVQLIIRLNGHKFGTNSSSSPRRCGAIMRIGPSTSNLTGMNSWVNVHLILKPEVDQSVSAMLSKAAKASLG